MEKTWVVTSAITFSELGSFQYKEEAYLFACNYIKTRKPFCNDYEKYLDELNESYDLQSDYFEIPSVLYVRSKD